MAALSEKLQSPLLRWSALLLLALWLRWPLPEPQWQHVDELAFIDYPLGFWSGDLNPHFFNYPTFHLYLLSALYYLYFLLCGSESLLSFIAYRYFADGHDLLAIARGLNSLLASGTVGVTILLGRRLYGEKGGFLAGLILALMPLHVRFSHLAITDVPAAFWASLALLWALRLIQEGGKRTDALLAGLFAGLAGATKYPAALVALPVLGAAWCSGTHRWRNLGTAAVTALLVAAIATPYVWLDYTQFWSHFSTMGQEHLLDSGHRGSDPAWLNLIRYHLRYGLGIVGVATLLIALFWKPRDWRAEERVIAACLSVFVILLAASQSTFMRYALPLAVPAALLMARPILGLIPELSQGYRRWIWAGWLVVLLAEPAYHSLQTRLMLSGPDTRVQIRQWLAQQPEGLRLTQAPDRAGDLGVLTPLWVFARQSRFVNSFDAERLHAAYASLGQRQYLPPLYLTFDADEAGIFATADPAEAASSLLLLWCDHPLCGGDQPPADLEPFIHWQQPVSPGASTETVFDQADWYFVPIGGWESTSRSGPSFHIGQILLRLANPTPATQTFFQLLDHLLTARQATAQERRTEALDHYRQILDSPFYLPELFTYSFLYDMYINAGVLYLEQGDPTAAISCWQEAAQTYPERPDPPYRIALAYSRLGQWA
ncbi:MAG: glycosyltransferase family 39 protein [Candidatus Handelsmanbacteria bacterium]|nr:glycosyltransferase family 39 protein [Candidatus Handelsmanbacteria bacterium]